MTRQDLGEKRRILVKVGSRVLRTNTGLNYRVIEHLCDEISALYDTGRQFALVSSGAIAAGGVTVETGSRSESLSRKQALAAIGQGRLIQGYNSALGRYGYHAAQILITRDDLDKRHRYLNIRNTLSELFDLGAIPVINENDTVSVDEIQFSDNDILSSMIIPLVEAQVLIILTETNGLYDSDPSIMPRAERISQIKEIKPGYIQSISADAGAFGRGGMQSKLRAAYHASRLGIPTVIASAYDKGVIRSILDGADVGTFVYPRTTGKLTQKDHWISFVTRPKGALVVDEGASKMIRQGGKSLLACGILGIEGRFKAGDSVEIMDPDNRVIAVGLSNFSVDEVGKIMGVNSTEISGILGKDTYEEVVHRNNMILKKEMV
ncbi:MAG: glutamate 5-kinase [Thermodesulfobacteriota bacterium]|nr:glutamate 5-kinase [Thermodesulfobacteriota bacterium]